MAASIATARPYLYALAPGIFDRGLQVSGIQYLPLAFVLWGLTALLLGAAIVHDVGQWHMKRRAAGMAGLDSWYFIIPCLLIAALAVGAAAYGLGMRSAAAKDDAKITAGMGTKLANNLVVSHDFQTISLRGTLATDESIEIRVQYKAAGGNNPMQTYSLVVEKGQSATVKITEIKSFSGNQLAVTLISDISVDGHPSLRWGSDRYGSPPDQSPGAGGMVARVLLVGASKKPEVYSYFALVPKISPFAHASLPAPRPPLMQNLILVPQEAIDAAKNWD